MATESRNGEVFKALGKGKVKSKEDQAYDEGRKAALAEHSLTKYRTLYRRNAELWIRFQLGYLDTVRDMRRAQAQKEAKRG